MSQVWEALDRNGRVLVQVRTEDEEVARTAIAAAVAADPSAAPEGYYVGDTGRDLSRDCICRLGLTNFLGHSRGCVLNKRLRAAYDEAGRRMCSQ